VGDSDLRRILLVATVSALGLTALIAIVALLSGDFGDTQVRILATTGGFGIASLISMRGTALLDRGLFLPLAWSVIGLSGLAFVLEFALVWISDGEPESLWKSLVVVVAFAGALGEIAGMLARRRTSDPDSITLLAWAAGACALLLAFLVTTAVLDEVDDNSFYRFLGVVAVLNVLMLVLQPVVRRLGHAAPVPAAPPTAPGGFVCVLQDGRRIRREMRGSDRADAVAASLRELERRGERVHAIEFDR
jgi:hypothetical protein